MEWPAHPPLVGGGGVSIWNFIINICSAILYNFFLKNFENL